MATYYRKDSNGLIFKVEIGNVYCFNETEGKWMESNKSSIDFSWNGIDYEEITEAEAMNLTK